MRMTILEHSVGTPSETFSFKQVAFICVYDMANEGPTDRPYMLVCARGSETYHSQLLKTPRDAASAWLDAIIKAENLATGESRVSL